MPHARRALSASRLAHPPTSLTPGLRAEIDRLRPVRFIIGPYRVHYWWIPEWKATFPEASVYLAPRIKEQAKGRIYFDTLPLERDSGYPWDAEIAMLLM